jgi:hypothetical protein
MAAKRKPDDIVNLKLRFIEAMRARLEQEAKRNHRSLNSEIVHRLAISFGPEGAVLAQQYEERSEELRQHLMEIVKAAAEQVRHKQGKS